MEFLRARPRTIVFNITPSICTSPTTKGFAWERLPGVTLEVVSVCSYTKQQMRDLISYAAGYHEVAILPEIDMPGHMTQILVSHPDLALERASGKLSLDLSTARREGARGAGFL